MKTKRLWLLASNHACSGRDYTSHESFEAGYRQAILECLDKAIGPEPGESLNVYDRIKSLLEVEIKDD